MRFRANIYKAPLFQEFCVLGFGIALPVYYVLVGLGPVGDDAVKHASHCMMSWTAGVPFFFPPAVVTAGDRHRSFLCGVENVYSVQGVWSYPVACI